jgi:hypothetical protein
MKKVEFPFPQKKIPHKLLNVSFFSHQQLHQKWIFENSINSQQNTDDDDEMLIRDLKSKAITHEN